MAPIVAEYSQDATQETDMNRSSAYVNATSAMRHTHTELMMYDPRSQSCQVIVLAERKRSFCRKRL